MELSWLLSGNKDYNNQEEYISNILSFVKEARDKSEFTPGNGVKIADRIYLNQDHVFQWPDKSVFRLALSLAFLATLTKSWLG